MIATLRKYAPSFRTSCLTICILYVLLTGSLFLQGFQKAMLPFKVPPEILRSPHYLDAMHWVYTHMLVIGLIVGVLGLYAESTRLKQNMSRLLFVAHIYYRYMDFRASDSIVGTGLYKGPASLIPAFIALGVTLLLLHMSFTADYDA